MTGAAGGRVRARLFAGMGVSWDGDDEKRGGCAAAA